MKSDRMAVLGKHTAGWKILEVAGSTETPVITNPRVVISNTTVVFINTAMRI